MKFTSKHFGVTVLHQDGDVTGQLVEADKALSTLQDLVGGPIEIVGTHQHDSLQPGWIFIVNEEGRIFELPPNPHVPGLVGDVVITRQEYLR